MTPYYADPWLAVYAGDCRAVMAEMPEQSVHCVVTSPPYWGLRDYGAEGQIGLEPTPEAYVETMVAVFREVRRVLRDDGTVWLNLGDSYYSQGGHTGPGATSQRNGRSNVAAQNHDNGRAPVRDAKVKDLVGIPWLVAFALRADGWYLRSDVVWSKPNPMPESVTDRPTKSHEYVFLLAKGQWKTRVIECADLSSERLHFGADLSAKRPDLVAGDFGIRLASAILDRAKLDDELRLSPLDPQVREKGDTGESSTTVSDLPMKHWAAVLSARLLRSDIAPKEFLSELHRCGVALADGDELLIGDGLSPVPLPPGVSRYGEAAIAIHYPGEVRQLDLRHNRIVLAEPSTCRYYFDADAVRENYVNGIDAAKPWAANGGVRNVGGRTDGLTRGTAPEWEPSEPGRNLRSVWTIATQPYPGAHFATFPEALVERCVKAGSPVDGVVLDCFAGSGTTGRVAQRLGRRAVLIDLNPAYLIQAMVRNRDIPLGLGLGLGLGFGPTEDAA